MKMNCVNGSSQVSALGFEDGILQVNYIHGGLYRYENIPEELYQRLLKADSVGKMLATEVKAHPDKFPYKKVK